MYSPDSLLVEHLFIKGPLCARHCSTPCGLGLLGE